MDWDGPLRVSVEERYLCPMNAVDLLFAVAVVAFSAIGCSVAATACETTPSGNE